jgi:hypothetical protein
MPSYRWPFLPILRGRKGTALDRNGLSAVYIFVTQVDPLQKVAWPSWENTHPTTEQAPAGAAVGPLYRFAATVESESDPLASPAAPLPSAREAGPMRENPVSHALVVTLAVLDQHWTLRLGYSL